ncbi:MAG TPA: YihY/virulence factor BrkB family protein [Burkholderiales bacterium]|nr:YihY/virulence factor BrkB family protein [Burkholderiales bacterium]
MNLWRELVTRLCRVRDAVPGLRVFVLAFQNYIRHQSANHAGSVAFSAVLASCPLLLFLSAAAGYIGQPGAAAELVSRILSFAPPAVADTLQPVVDEVLAQRNRALLAVGVIFTIWTASSGMQAIRTALNKAYGVDKGLSFWGARIKVTLFTVIGTVGTVLAFASIIVLPYLWTALDKAVGGGAEATWVWDSVRYALAFFVLTMVYAAMYGWLPDIRQRLLTVLPGALVGALMWVAAAYILSYTLRSLGKLALVYGSFAGLVATLVFLYVSAVTLIFGAEINGVLRDDRTPQDAETNS